MSGSSERSVGPRLSLMMFLQFFVWGAYYVSMTGWMARAEIGGLAFWAYTVGPIAALISPFFLGLVADRFFATQRVLCALHVLGGLALLAIPPVVAWSGLKAPTAGDATFFHPFVLLLQLHMLCYMPTLGLTNSLSFHHMARPEKQFPVVRVFGTIGWIVGSIVSSGNLIPWGVDLSWIAAGEKSEAQFYVAGTAGVLLGLYALTLPHTPPPGAGQRPTVKQMLGLDSLRLLKQRSYLVFIVCSFLICIPLAGYYAQARVYVETVGYSNPTLTMSYGQMSEILFMLLMPLCFARLGVKWMIAVGMLAWVARYGLFSLGAADRVMWMALLGVLLHGICYDFFFVTGFIYVDRAAPKEIRGQAQGFLVLVTQGLGLGIGAQVFGQIVKGSTGPEGGVNWAVVWLVPCLMAAVILAAFVLLFKDRRAADGA